jgi:ribulose-phosphate 3-epimerase
MVSNQHVEITASIACVNWMNVGGDLKVLEENKVESIHYDLMDGFFAPDYCMGSTIIEAIQRNTAMPGFFHLMIEEPSRMFSRFKFSSRDACVVHYEACRNLHRDIMTLRNIGCQVGVVMNPATPLEVLDYVIEDLDLVMAMTVNPGFIGQKLVPQTIKKIERLRRRITEQKLNIKIGVDGNVNAENIPNMVAAGADILVGGSSGLFKKSQPLEQSIREMRALIAKGLQMRPPDL